MLTKRSIQDQICRNASRLTACRINKIGLFGSYARQEQRPDSDIDILIDFEAGKETLLSGLSA